MTKMKNNKTKKSLIQYGVIAAIALILYTTGMHAEVIGFAQRGLLATGLMNPNIEKVATKEATKEKTDVKDKIKADLSMKFRDPEGNIKTLEDFKGKVIFINMWATWCPPCIAEMPSIDKLHEKMGDEVAFVMLSLDRNFDKAIDFDKRKGYDLPIYTRAAQLPQMYQSAAIPTTYVIDAEGNLALTHKGMADYGDDEFVDFLKSLQ
ncbi:Thiol-disulfide isomerase or thioredoxin [Salegentibacter echinorum]|uniref:Thiol-disulfide isomerase or thioredoxin n=1 Tax=Salegentibacter echinorum TaxID=1073325 RepID=A0A1M5JKD1_SALEC|nr:Thiol-disulfide isomerase or thioredoxin [Salegentibacter echinorum]